MTVARVVLSTMLVGMLVAQGFSAKVNLSVDIDSTHGLGDFPQYPIITQPGFTSWDLSSFYPSASGSTTLQNISFELISSDDFPQEHGSRNRISTGGGGEGVYNDLLQDFVFAESSFRSSPPDFLELRIAGLSIGDYRMQSWHFDSFFTVELDNNKIQIEIGNAGAAQEVVISEFPLGIEPATYDFSVTEVGQVKEITFLALDSPEAFTRRTRLNGFTLVSIPEPATVGLAFTAIFFSIGSWLFRRRH